MATDTESVEFHRLQKIFTETPLVHNNPTSSLPNTQVIATSPPRSSPDVRSAPSNQTAGTDNTNNGKVQFPIYPYSQAYLGETQKDPDTSVDGNSQSQDRLSSGGARGRVTDATPPELPPRPASAGLEALVAEIEESEQTAQVYDESRRFDSPHKVQRNESVTPRAPRPFGPPDSVTKGLPMGLTQLFNNTQASPLRPQAATFPPGFVTPVDSPNPRKSPLKMPVAPDDITPQPGDAYYSIAESQEARERRLGKERNKHKSPTREGPAGDEELETLFDEQVVNRRTRKVTHAQRKNDEEVEKALENIKTARENKNSRAKGKKSEKEEQTLKTERAGSKTRLTRVDKDAKRKRKIFEVPKIRQSGEKRKRRQPVHEESATDEEEPPPPREPGPAKRIHDEKEGHRCVDSAIRETPPQLPNPPSELDWDAIHKVPERPPRRQGSRSFLRKRSTAEGSESRHEDGPKRTNSGDGSQPLPPIPPTGKSSIRNLPPFNVPLPGKFPPLLSQSSTFAGLDSNPYQGSSSIPMPPPRSSPPIISMEGHSTTQVERSPSPQPLPQSHSEERCTVNPALETPGPLTRKTRLFRGNTIPETSPSDGKYMLTPFMQTKVQTGIEDEALNSSRNRAIQAMDTPVPQSKRKRGRPETPADPAEETRAESVVPCSLPEETIAQTPAGSPERVKDVQGDVNMSRQGSPSQNGGDAGTDGAGESPRKKRRANPQHPLEGSMKENVGSKVAAEKSTPASKPTTNNKTKSGKSSKSSTKKSSKNTPGSHKGKSSLHTPLQAVSTTPTPGHIPNLGVHTPSIPTSDSITNPHFRVFALFKDNKMYYHPATLLPPSINVSESQVRVVFDDGTEDLIHKYHIKQLDLRVGDVVKCDLPNMKPKFWVVVGFPDRPSPVQVKNHLGISMVDIYGHTAVLLKQKQKGTIFGVNTAGNTQVHTTLGEVEDDDGVIGDAVEAPVTRLYLVKSLWSQFLKRDLDSSPAISPMNGRSRLSIGPLETPPAGRDRRPTPLFKEGAGHAIAPVSIHHSGKKAPIAAGKPSGIFSGMVFALSFGDNEAMKKSVTTKILANGGTILESGFEELFIPIDDHGLGGKSIKSTSATTTIMSNASDTERDTDSVRSELRERETSTTSNFGISGPPGDNEHLQGLRSLPTTTNITFACVIADKYSRRVKFLQALALGLPCLSGRFIEDSIRKGQLIKHWEMYLLPAGESSYLGGTIRSRVLPPSLISMDMTSPSGFLNMLEVRDRLLDGMRVLLVLARGRGGEKRKPYWFLTWALGAKAVRRVGAVEEANEVLKSAGGAGEWDYVYLDSGGGGKGLAWKERALWRDVELGEERRPRVVDDEWVVQSLILGRLVEE